MQKDYEISEIKLFQIEFYSSEFKLLEYKDGAKIDYQNVTYKQLDQDFDDFEI